MRQDAQRSYLDIKASTLRLFSTHIGDNQKRIKLVKRRNLNAARGVKMRQTSENGNKGEENKNCPNDKKIKSATEYATFLPILFQSIGYFFLLSLLCPFTPFARTHTLAH